MTSISTQIVGDISCEGNYGLRYRLISNEMSTVGLPMNDLRIKSDDGSGAQSE